ncbi:MAG: rRNA (cytosine-C5-)-methyltransferase nop2 [Lichina confinis]|nr:MAG: rRNA (cytosine-C5-)-methyltransferase nop2 [Lichina confinis]
MGVGRRMKKQGPPAELSEAFLRTLKKRKAGRTDEDDGSKKRRLSDDSAPAKKHQKPGNNPKKAARPKQVKKQHSQSGVKANARQQGRGPTTTGQRVVKAKPPKIAPQTPVNPLNDPDNTSDLSELEHVASGSEDAFPEEDTFLGVDENDVETDDDLAEQDEFKDMGDSVFDSDEDQGPNAMFSEDEGESDAEDKLTAANIEGLSRKLDLQREEMEVQAQEELEDAAMQTNIAGDKPKVLGDADDEEDGEADGTDARLEPDLQLLRTRITDTIRVLDDFATLAEEGRSRAEYTSQLLKDICAYYGYSAFLAEKLFAMFPPREAFAFFEANETARPVVIRTNTLRTHRRELAQSLINRGVTLEPVGKWSKVGLQIFESQVPLGATPEYLAGHYILQAASSFLPVMALAPQEHERTLDMAAAPGGKTTYMAALMKNTGCIFANDSNKARTKGLIGNIHRLGVKNTVVCNYDAKEFPRVMGGFDRVLLDAPCSGTGVIAKDPSVKTNKTEKDFLFLPHQQKQLLLAAIDSVDHASKTGGYVVYSTCSVTVEENEQVVQYALSKRPNVRLVETGLPFGKDGFSRYKGKVFDARMKMAKRYYPHTYNVDGFFVAKLKKTGPTVAGGSKQDQAGVNGESASSEPISMKPNGHERHSKKQADADDQPAEQSDGFALFNDPEDEKYIQRSLMRAMRRKGRNPKALGAGKKTTTAKEKAKT